MAFTRTRIWRGGNFERRSDDEEPGSVPLVAVPESPRRAASARGTPVGSPIPGASATPEADYIAGFAPSAPRAQAATRFMPIEELFPEQAAEAAQHASLARQAARASRPERALIQTPTGLRGTQRKRARRWPVLVLALASLALGTTLWSRDVRVALGARLARVGAVGAHRARAGAAGTRQAQSGASAHDAERRSPKDEAMPGAAAPALGAARANGKAGARAASARAESSQPLAAGVERAAIDALIAGDFARAEKLYARLSRGNPPEAIREALRILSSRHDTRAP